MPGNDILFIVFDQKELDRTVSYAIFVGTLYETLILSLRRGGIDNKV